MRGVLAGAGGSHQKNSKRNQRVSNVSCFSSQRSLADLSRCYARGKQGVNQRTTRGEKEKICVAIISAKRNAMRISAAPQQTENDSNCRRTARGSGRRLP